MPAVAAPVSVKRGSQGSKEQLRNDVVLAWVEAAALVCDWWLWCESPAATGWWASVAVSVAGASPSGGRSVLGQWQR